MRRFPIKTLKHLPYQMATLYFILFIISIVASVITVNCGDAVFKTYTSCQGSKVYNINWIGGVLIIQILLCFVSVDPDPGKKTDEGETQKETKGGEGTKGLGFVFNRSFSILSRGLSNNDIRVDIDGEGGTKKKGKRLRTQLRAVDGESSSEGGDQGRARLRLLEPSDSILTTKLVAARDVIRRRVRICWSSIWMVSYNFVIFMGVHGSVLASRIHAHISMNKYGIETCPHLTYFPFSLSSPTLEAPILSESVLLVTYISFTIHEIVIRKTENCFLIKNFFGKHYFKESVVLGSIRLIIQTVLFVGNFALIVLCVTTGFGSPMHVLVGFSISMLALWINSLFSQLLELTHYGEMKAPTLDYSYIWSILSAFVLWFCGFFYYVSVYGVPYRRLYLYLNPLSWIILISLTYYKRREIFNCSQHLQSFVPTFT